MSVSFSVNQCNNQPAFKGSMKRTQQGNPYYSTNSGAKIGSGFAAFSALGGLGWLGMSSFIKKAGKMGNASAVEAEGINQLSNLYKKLGVYCIAVGIPLYIGCGMIVDYFRNQKAKQAADLVGQVGVKNAMAQNQEIDLSLRNQPYLNSNSGATTGLILGAIANPVSSLIFTTSLEKNREQMIKTLHLPNLPKSNKTIGIISSAITGAIGGWLLGMWADHNSNKAAEKYT